MIPGQIFDYVYSILNMDVNNENHLNIHLIIILNYTPPLTDNVKLTNRVEYNFKLTVTVS